MASSQSALFRTSPIAAAECRPLRHQVLRPHQTPEALVYPGDDAPKTLHLGGFLGGELVGVASLYLEAPEGSDEQDAWRLRGMAIAPEHQGRGLGRVLLERCHQALLDRGGRRVWCNARTSAAGFYRALGYVEEGPEFELADIGLHHRMSHSLT